MRGGLFNFRIDEINKCIFQINWPYVCITGPVSTRSATDPTTPWTRLTFLTSPSGPSAPQSTFPRPATFSKHGPLQIVFTYLYFSVSFEKRLKLLWISLNKFVRLPINLYRTRVILCRRLCFGRRNAKRVDTLRT